MNLKLLFFTLATILFLGCSGDGPKTPEKENGAIKESNATKVDVEKLQQENKKLKEVLFRLTKSKKKQFEAMVAAMVAGDEESVYKKSIYIEKEYPESKEAQVAKKYRSKIASKYRGTLQSSLAQMKKRVHKPLKSVWYYDKNLEATIATAPVFIYISQKEDKKPALRIRFQTTNESLNKTSGFILFSDSSSYDIIPPKSDIKQKQIKGGLWSWYDKPLTEEEVTMLKDVVYAKKPVIRFIKENRYEELPIAVPLRNAIIRTIRTYYAMEKTARYQ